MLEIWAPGGGEGGRGLGKANGWALSPMAGPIAYGWACRLWAGPVAYGWAYHLWLGLSPVAGASAPRIISIRYRAQPTTPRFDHMARMADPPVQRCFGFLGGIHFNVAVCPPYIPSRGLHLLGLYMNLSMLDHRFQLLRVRKDINSRIDTEESNLFRIPSMRLRQSS